MVDANRPGRGARNGGELGGSGPSGEWIGPDFGRLGFLVAPSCTPDAALQRMTCAGKPRRTRCFESFDR
jgi:hypothetical protein